jgi:hypothetical protein
LPPSSTTCHGAGREGRRAIAANRVSFEVVPTTVDIGEVSELCASADVAVVEVVAFTVSGKACRLLNLKSNFYASGIVRQNLPIQLGPHRAIESNNSQVLAIGECRLLDEVLRAWDGAAVEDQAHGVFEGCCFDREGSALREIRVPPGFAIAGDNRSAVCA